MSIKSSEVKVTLGKTVFNKDNEVKTLNYKVLEMNQRICDVELENTSLKEKIKELEKDKLDLISQVDQMKGSYHNIFNQFLKIKESFEECQQEIKDADDKEKSLINTISLMQDEISYLQTKAEILQQQNEDYKEEIEMTEKIKSRLENNFISTCKILEESNNKNSTLEKIVKKKDQFLDMYKKNENKYKNSKTTSSNKDCQIQVKFDNNDTAGVKLQNNTDDVVEDRESKRMNSQKDMVIKSLQKELEKKDILIKNLEREKNNLFVRLKNKVIK